MRRSPVTFSAVLALVALAGVAGCTGGHGKYVEEFRQEAQNRMAQLKAATEYDMAHQQFLAGDLDKSLKTVERSIALHPEVATSHLLRARVLLELDRLEAALDALDRAEIVQPESAEAAYYRGIIFERFTKFEDALASYEEARRRDETNAQYAVAQAEMLMQIGELDSANAILQDTATIFEHNPGVRQTMGHIAMMRGDTAGALKLFQEACLLAPDDPALIEDLARAQIAAGDFAEADYSLSRLLTKPSHADRRDLKHLLARCLLRTDRPVEARTVYLELVEDERGDADPEAWIGLAEAALRLNDDFRLRRCAQRLVAIAPDRVDGYVLLAMWQQRQGDTDRALATLDRAIRRASSPSDAAAYKAALLHELGDVDSARVAAELALERNPQSRSAMAVLRSIGSSSSPMATVGVED